MRTPHGLVSLVPVMIDPATFYPSTTLKLIRRDMCWRLQTQGSLIAQLHECEYLLAHFRVVCFCDIDRDINKSGQVSQLLCSKQVNEPWPVPAV